MQTKINKAVSQIIQDVVKRPLYPESKHITMASNYPEGKLKYYSDQRFELLKAIPKRTMFGNAWVNSGAPKVNKVQIIVDFYNNEFMNPVLEWKSQSEFMDFLKSDFSTFLRDYIAYNRFLKEIMERDPNPKSLDFKLSNKELSSIFDQFRKDGCIAKETDYDYFKYAFRGDVIPSQKQPYQPIKWVETKNRLYRELKDIETKYENNNQKSLTNQRKEVQFLFLANTGKPMKPLTTPT